MVQLLTVEPFSAIAMRVNVPLSALPELTKLMKASMELPNSIALLASVAESEIEGLVTTSAQLPAGSRQYWLT